MNRQERLAYVEKRDQEYRAKLKDLADEQSRLEKMAQARKVRAADLEQEQRDLAAHAVDAGDVERSILVTGYGKAVSELALIPAELKVIGERIDRLNKQIGALQNDPFSVRRPNG
ncbi:MAG TPA: hypothetical protein VMY40_15655 [Anaerolineae bacterium]|nr:hypothetical protein [Anaerolineae bacterium]